MLPIQTMLAEQRELGLVVAVLLCGGLCLRLILIAAGESGSLG